MSAFHVMEQPARPRSLTNLALHLGGSNQLLPFHVQPNYLLESLFKPKEEERGGGETAPSPLPLLHGVNYCIFIWEIEGEDSGLEWHTNDG